MSFRRQQGSPRTERWQREDESPRLSALVPSLIELRLELKATRDGREVPGSKMIRLVVIARAGAHFEFPCTNPACEGGGHDTTHEIVLQLGHGRSVFSGRSTCSGYVGDHACDYVLEYTGRAVYSGA